MVKSVSRSTGISRKKDPLGKKYDICTINCLSPFENRSWDKDEGSGQIEGYGAQDYELPLDPAAMPSFKNFDYPCEIDLIIDERIVYGRLSSYVIGCKPQPNIKAA
jgi:hypothetical protein